MRPPILLAAIVALSACDPAPEPDPSAHHRFPTVGLHAGRTALGDAGLIRVTWRAAGEVPVLGTNAFTLELASPSGAPLDDALVALDLFMPMHGHGSSARPQVTASRDGRYEATNVVFQMAGEWHLTVHAQKGSLDDAATFVVDVQ